MKRALVFISLLAIIVLSVLFLSRGGMAQEIGEPVTAKPATAELDSAGRPAPSPGGMPGWPIPVQPIPHHEPGQPSKAASYSTQATRLNAEGVAETVTLTGLDGLLADGVIEDPLQGNRGLVDLDKILVGMNNEISTYSAISGTAMVTLPELISGSWMALPHNLSSVAAGDLNADGQAEQIAAWLDNDSHLNLSIGEMPGSLGKTTSPPVAIARSGTPGSGYSLGFDGADDYMDAGDQITLTNSSFTVAFWARRPNTDPDEGDYAIGQGLDEENQGLHIGFRGSNAFTCAFYNNDLDTAAYTDTEWHYWACTYDADMGRRAIYQDGLLVAWDNAVPYQGSGTLNIGRVPWDSFTPHPEATYFDGFIDEVGIWSVARTEEQIQADLFRTITGDEPDLMAYWRFDEGSGTEAADATGNGHTGTLVNGPVWDNENAPSGDVHLLVRGYDQALWHCNYELDTSSCLEWNNDAGGLLLSGPAVTTRGADQLDVFALRRDNRIYHTRWYTSTWTEWQLVDEGGDWITPTHVVPMPEYPAPAAVARGTDEFDLFRRGPDNTLRWRHFNGTSWEAWQDLGGFLTSSPAAVSLGADHLQVFARGLDYAVWYLNYTSGSGWGAWERLDMPAGISAAFAPAALSTGSDRVNLYVPGSDGALWGITSDGGVWSPWESLGGEMVSSVGASAWSGGINLFAQEADGGLQGNSFNGSTWSGWASLGGISPCCQVTDTGASVGADLDVQTGYFSGDSRPQILVAFINPSEKVHLQIYDVDDGFGANLLSEYILDNYQADRIKITTGDFDADGTDEFAVYYRKRGDDNSYDYVIELFDVIVSDDQLGIVWGQSLPKTVDVQYGWLEHWHSYILDADIVSGDFDTDGDEELAIATLTSSTGRTSIITTINAWKTDLQIIDVPSLDSLVEKGISIIWYREWNDIEPIFVPCRGCVELETGNLDDDLDGVANGDEIVVSNSIWDERTLLVYNVDTSDTNSWTLIQKALRTLPHWTWTGETQNDGLVVGDFNRDLYDEIALMYPYWPASDDHRFLLDVSRYVEDGDENGETGIEPVGVYEGTAWGWDNLELAADGFTGEGLRLGEPTYRFQRSTGDIIALINEPPKHIDILDGVTYDLNSTDTSTYAAYETQTSQSTSMSLQVQRDYGLSAGLETVIGAPTGTHIRGSIDATYGAHFENTTTSFNEIIFGAEVKAINDDIVKYTGKDLRIWEYPIYDDNSGISTDSLIVAFPEPTASNTGTREFIESGNSTCDFWYAPEHQVNNVWSYASLISQLKDYDETKGILNNGASYTIGVNAIEDACTTWADATVTQAASSVNTGVNKLAELQIGGDKVTVSAAPFGIGIKFDLFVPSVKGTLQSSFSKSALSTHSMTGSDTTSICTFFNSIDPSGIYNYEVTPYLYWSQDGYLVLDYTTRPTNSSFWNMYDKPDPAFILPWSDGHCTGKEQFTKDIVINPPFAGNGETVVITATLHNFSDEPVQDVPLRFCLGDPGAGCVQIGDDQSPDQTVDLPERGKVDVAVSWQASGTGEQRIYALIDPRHEITEMHDETTNPEKNNNIAFGVFSMGDSGYLDPGGEVYFDYQTITYTDTLGIPASVYLPAASLEETVRFEMIPLPDTHQGFRLTAYQAGSGRDQPWTDLAFDPVPAVIWLRYSDGDVSGMEEESLILYTYNEDGGEWVDAACGEYQRYPEENWMLVPVCSTGDFSLLQNRPVFLPLIMK